MNVSRLAAFPHRPSGSPRPGLAAAPVIRYRERDFGIGYGSSSGYAADRRYASDWAAAPFRCR